MPQILKTEIKEKILQNALDSFLQKGYKNTSMKEIALASGISVGNVYNYFKDKETLYDALVMSVFEEINKLFDTPPKNTMEAVDEKLDEFIEIYKRNKKVFIMLMENSGNTKFENLKNTIIENFAAAIERFRYKTAKIPVSPAGAIFLKAFASGFVNGIIVILKQASKEKLQLDVLQKFSSNMKGMLIKLIIEKRGYL